MRNTVVKKLNEFYDKNNDVCFITADMGFGAFEPVFEKYGKKRALNVGIAEQNMASFSAGLGLGGKKVFTYSISTFPTLRCLEQIRDDICYHELDISILNVGTGFEYGPLGITHHSTEDIAILRAIPNMKVYAPANARETELVMDEVFKIGGPSYIRLSKLGAEDFSANSTTINFAQNNNGKYAIFSTGTIMQEALDFNKLNNNKLDIYSVVNYFKNQQEIAEMLKKYDKIISLEEHQISGGLYSYLCEIKNKFDLNVKIIPLAIKDEFTCTVGKQKELRKHYHIGKDAILETCIKEGML